MGILANAVVILAGVFIGSLIKKEVNLKKFAIFGICVGIISLVSFIENLFEVDGTGIRGAHLYSVVFALIIGSLLGEFLKIEDRVSWLVGKSQANGGIIESSVFFAIGGLQVSGPILLAVSGDNSLLFLKCAIDFPFAIMFGTIYGKRAMFSAIPVAVIQLIIAIIAYCVGEFISAETLAQLCSVGYVILFFSGFNMLVSENVKVKTVNMLPSIALIILINSLF